MESFPHGRLVFNLADFVIETTVDCAALFDEIESIQDDYPDQLVVFEVSRGNS